MISWVCLKGVIRSPDTTHLLTVLHSKFNILESVISPLPSSPDLKLMRVARLRTLNQHERSQDELSIKL